jgi:glutamate dehydrogenase/leucine dehydrogenase
MSTYTPEEYTMKMTISEEEYDRLTQTYAKALASSMQRTKDMIAGDIFKRAVRRSKEHNPYTHGALNAIHKDT